MLQKRLLVPVLVASLLLSSAAAAPASADAQVDAALTEILRSNPAAHRVSANAVNVAPGVDVIYGQVDTLSAAATPTARYCVPYDLCLWERTSTDGFGYGLALYYCQSSGAVLDLNTLRYPDGANVGKGPQAQRWNDRVSAYENAQTAGTVARLYNWNGQWSLIRTSTAFDYQYNLGAISINDVIDGVVVCW